MGQLSRPPWGGPGLERLRRREGLAPSVGGDGEEKPPGTVDGAGAGIAATGPLLAPVFGGLERAMIWDLPALPADSGPGLISLRVLFTSARSE